MEVMVEEVGKFAAENADVPEAKKKKNMNWVAFRKRHGMRKRSADGSRDIPFEKEQWILRQINKFGRTRGIATAAWEKYDRDKVVDSDSLGFGGQLRLWLPKGEYRLTETETFVEGAAEEGTDKK